MAAGSCTSPAVIYKLRDALVTSIRQTYLKQTTRRARMLSCSWSSCWNISQPDLLESRGCGIDALAIAIWAFPIPLPSTPRANHYLRRSQEHIIVALYHLGVCTQPLIAVIDDASAHLHAASDSYWMYEANLNVRSAYGPEVCSGCASLLMYGLVTLWSLQSRNDMHWCVLHRATQAAHTLANVTSDPARSYAFITLWRDLQLHRQHRLTVRFEGARWAPAQRQFMVSTYKFAREMDANLLLVVVLLYSPGSHVSGC